MANWPVAPYEEWGAVITAPVGNCNPVKPAGAAAALAPGSKVAQEGAGVWVAVGPLWTMVVLLPQATTTNASATNGATRRAYDWNLDM
jgi:hypothetical protein